MSSIIETPGRPRVFVDMDGVLANFNKAASQVFGLWYPSEPAALHYNWVFEQYGRQHQRELPHEEFIDVLRGRTEFWATMGFYWWARRLTHHLSAQQYEWYILTHCIDDPGCPFGKHTALKRHFGESIIKRTFMTFGTKHQMCRPGDVLIDDADKNCVAWRQAGGVAFNWVDYTENHPQAEQQVEQLFSFLQELDYAAC